MTTQEARDYFVSKGLSYKDISPVDFKQLRSIVSTNLTRYRATTDHAAQMDMKIRKMVPKDKRFNKGSLVRGRILIDGSYFHAREGITFHESGFIGFCGEFSTVNSEPILQAFVKWCDDLAEIKAKTAQEEL